MMQDTTSPRPALAAGDGTPSRFNGLRVSAGAASGIDADRATTCGH